MRGSGEREFWPGPLEEVARGAPGIEVCVHWSRTGGPWLAAVRARRGAAACPRSGGAGEATLERRG